VTDQHPAERRVLEALSLPDLPERLASLPGTDFTSLLLAVMRARAAQINAPGVLRAYREGRFARPSPTPMTALRSVENAFLDAVPSGWETITLSPVVPFATHASMARVSQNRVLAAVRGTEVAADPTNALALEAALRRRAKRHDTVRLATLQRVTRGQEFPSRYAPHFSLFALVTAGRRLDTDRFGADALVEHLNVHVSGIRAAGADEIRILLTGLSDGQMEGMFQRVDAEFESSSDVEVARDPEREGGRSYYETVCFKVRASFGANEFEVSDGGFTDWTARLVADRREQTFISGSGLDPIAALE
jgi:hypothetical protein